MTGLPRAFVAVVPPPDVLDAVEHVLAPIRSAAPPQLMWSRRAQWHLTLQFLGRVDHVEALTTALERGMQARGQATLGLGAAGAFPSAQRASVVWVGLDQGADDLAAIADEVATATAPLGFRGEGRPFTPHLTVARTRGPTSVATLLASIGPGPFGRVWDAPEILLMESDTRPSGAVYREVARFPLEGPEAD